MSDQRGGSPEFYRTLQRMASLHARKSADYGDEEDPLANVRAGADLLGVPDWQACLVRIADKLQRIKSYCRNGRLANEGVEDAIDDLASYAVIMSVLYRESNACLKPRETITTSQSAGGGCCGGIRVYKVPPSVGHTTATKSSSTNGSQAASD